MQETEPKIYDQKIKVKGHTYKRYCVDFGTVDGKRVRRTFKTEVEAEKAKDDHVKLSKKIGRQARRLSDTDLLDAAKAQDILERRVTLATAATFYMNHNFPGGGEKTVNEAIEGFVQSRKEKGCREVTVKGYKDKLAMFARDMNGRDIRHVTVAILEDWFRKRDFSAESKQSYLRTIAAFFQWAAKRRYIIENPARSIDMPLTDKKKVTYLSVPDAEKLLRTAEKQRPELIPYIAIAMFAGLRPSELHGDKTEHEPLNWSCIDLDKKLIRLAPEQTKTRDGRNVAIRENLEKWLLPYFRSDGPIHYNRSQFLSVVKASKITYSKDILRHTAGTYLYAITRHEGETAIQLGDTIQTIKKHYVNPLVEPGQAEKFWGIMPKLKGKIIEFRQAAS